MSPKMGCIGCFLDKKFEVDIPSSLNWIGIGEETEKYPSVTPSFHFSPSLLPWAPRLLWICQLWMWEGAGRDRGRPVGQGEGL